MKKVIGFGLIVFVMSAFFQMDGICDAASPVKLKAVCFLPTNHPAAFMTHEWVKRVNEGLEGEVTVEYIGGPETIPAMEQIEAIRNNVVQLGFVPTAYYQSLMPEGQAFSLLRLNPMQLRESGFHEFMVDRHERIGVRYLGMWVWTSFYLWSKKPVENMDGLKGLKMRTSALYDRFMKALGIVPVTISASDTYTALERGTVDGFGWLLLGPRQMGWIETTKYIIDHPFFTMNTVIDMNLSTWNKLPEAVQSKIIKITKAFEPDMVARFDEMTSDEWGKLEAAGVKKIHFSPEEAKKYTNLAYEVEWEALKEKVPDLVPELKRLTGNE